MNIKKELVKTFQNLLGVYFGKVYSDSEIKVTAMEIGSKVEKINADGSLSPVEDGDYVMEDGSAFTVKDGVIESIVGEEVKAEDEETVEVVDEVPVTGDTSNVDEELEEAPVEDEKSIMEDRIKSLEDKMAELYSMLETMNSEKMEAQKAIETFNQEVKQLNQNIQTLAKVPVEFSKTSKSAVVEDSKEERLMDVARLIGRVK